MAKITPARRKLNAIARAVKELGEQGYFVSRCLEELRETFDLYADPRLQDPDIDVEIFIRIEVGVGSETLDAVKRIENFKTKKKRELRILTKESGKLNDPGRFIHIQFDEKGIVQSPAAKLLMAILEKMSTAKGSRSSSSKKAAAAPATSRSK